MMDSAEATLSAAPTAVAGYRPSPRPTYAAPSLVTRRDVTRYVWGDTESGLVADWIYASTDHIHLLVFGLAANGSFRHSREFRTVFAADEVLFVLSGAMTVANPETGEVVRAAAGESVFFRRDTWHHVFAHREEPLRVLEFFSPPPSTGSSGAYARTRPYLEHVKYADDLALGHLPGPGTGGFRVRRPDSLSWRREDGVSVGVIASTEHLTVAEVHIGQGVMSPPRCHGGDAMLYALDESLFVRTEYDQVTSTFEISPHDAVYVPLGASYELLNFGRDARALLGVAPSYLP